MDIVIVLIKNIAFLFLSAVQTAMFIRAILSWFMIDGGRLINFLYAITEPFIAPVRAFLVKRNWLQGSPIDFSFMITFLLLSIISIFLT